MGLTELIAMGIVGLALAWTMTALVAFWTYLILAEAIRAAKDPSPQPTSRFGPR